MLGLITVPTGGLYFNRFYNFLMVPRPDLALRHVLGSSTFDSLTGKPPLASSAEQEAKTYLERGGILTTRGIGYAMNATGATLIADTRKWMMWPTPTPPSLTTGSIIDGLRHVGPERVRPAIFRPEVNLTSAYSITGILSGHWLPNEVALEHAAQSELFAFNGFGLKQDDPQAWLEWYGPDPGASSGLVYRGRLPAYESQSLGKDGVEVIFRPVLRTPDGSGRRLVLVVRGPDFMSSREFKGWPNPLGCENWIFGDHHVRLNRPGLYNIEVTGTAFWPLRSSTVSYSFTLKSN